MSKKNIATDKNSGEQDIRMTVEQQLEKALGGWKEELGEKKFAKRIKKAGKIFSKKLKQPAAKV